MRRDVRVTKDIQRILFQNQLARLVLPGTNSRVRSSPSSGLLVVRGCDVALSDVDPAMLEYFDNGPNCPGMINNSSDIITTPKSHGVNSYVIGRLNLGKDRRIVTAPILFCYSEKAKAVIDEYCPF